MARPCRTCTSEHRKTIDTKIRSGTTYTDIALWLKGKGAPIGRNALARHAAHLGMEQRSPGPRPPAGTFLERIVAAVDDDIQAGRQRPTVAHGISAQAELNRQAARGEDKDLMIKIAMALTGRVPGYVPVRDPRVEAIEAEYQILLDGGTASEARAAGEAVRLEAGD